MGSETLEPSSHGCSEKPSSDETAFLNLSLLEQALPPPPSPPPPMVDSFLREALNSRNRLTVLRIEQEVEKFVRDPSQQQLQFEPMPSSYVRLVAHRVAQHYHLQSMVLVCNAAEGSRILVRKTSESRLPDVRLADIPLDPALQDKSVPASLEKVAIKQRETMGSKRNGYGNGAADPGSTTLAKTVEERKEEYNKARARIFSTVDLMGSIVEENGGPDIVAASKPEDKVASAEVQELTTRAGSASEEGKCRVGDDDFLKINSNRVAIFRDREKDKKDPDYDRNYVRYSQSFNPGFGLNLGPFCMHGIYAPVLSYNGQFPQIRLDQTPYITAQHLGGPWAASAGSSSFAQRGALFGHFSQVHSGLQSASDIYLQTSRITCPGQYTFTENRFQHSSVQPCLQPEASYRKDSRQ